MSRARPEPPPPPEIQLDFGIGVSLGRTVIVDGFTFTCTDERHVKGRERSETYEGGPFPAIWRVTKMKEPGRDLYYLANCRAFPTFEEAARQVLELQAAEYDKAKARVREYESALP